MIGALSTPELRRQFLIADLFAPGEARQVETELDGMIAAGIVPADAPLRLEPRLLDRREVGLINIGGPGAVRVDGTRYELGRLDCLYIGLGAEDVEFETAAGAAFYLLSAPAQQTWPTVKATPADATVREIGDEANASRRRLHQYIHPGGIRSCQLVMGFTELAPGSVWNTMPAHTHERRSEIYLYFDLGDSIVVHLLGAPGSTRHVIVRDREAVLSPRWSIHTGAGTTPYRFIWGMAGENQDFDDIDALTLQQLR